MRKNKEEFLSGAGIVGLIFSFLCFLFSDAERKAKSTAKDLALDFSRTKIDETNQQTALICGKGKQESIRIAVVNSIVERCAIMLNPDDIIQTGFGSTLCFDVYGKRFFYSDIEQIRQAVARLNQSDKEASINQLYIMWKIPCYPYGYHLGWRNQIDIRYSSHQMPDGTPVFALDYTVEML